jgi:predicted RNA-binding Zn-ribbon protein involved in translation (DUF1610 family)
MGAKLFGETYRHSIKESHCREVCEMCGTELEIDRESGESYCPVCDLPEE